ncbi:MULTISPECIES: ribonuclease domain-containing protein [Oleiagrimonas]|uniref:Ribonuclease n=1 Tax=Oleiagrimonas citrea TaxID=1665687 RepID=A0A846ZN50_9GAMM|nr:MULTISPECIES: ribonuclease domain-containing protein [Oleiagrimonas]NKZ38893.1 ribonuclease [Oleiagrimonas citrea]RAP59130.1 ribonuclease [Oleiagrimonas sp. MCCC 1A03011]
MRRLLLVAMLIAAALAFHLWQQPEHAPRTTSPTPVAKSESSALALPAFLPPEARQTVASIRRGGPFPYRRDGVVFGNRERLLPDKPRGYYHEYTVPTPGLRTRGARRIVTGGVPPEIFYYTDDHYRSFRSFKVQP